MSIQGILGKKIEQSQRFLENGNRIPVTKVMVGGNVVVEVKTKEKNGYTSVKIGFGIQKNPNKALLGIVKKTGIKTAPNTFREIRIADQDTTSMPTAGNVINASEVFKPGDIVDVTGVSKGKGYAGVVKRHHFKGGPRTHGQSDRERAPGSIGQTTTPGRVYKGKRMAGRMGQDNVTIKNLRVIDVSDQYMLVKGLLPGSINSLVAIKRVGEDKKFVPLYKEVSPLGSAMQNFEGQAEVSKGEEKKEEVKNAN